MQKLTSQLLLHQKRPMNLDNFLFPLSQLETSNTITNTKTLQQNALEMGESKLTLKAISSVIGNIEAIFPYKRKRTPGG
ncbi:MAG: hypothetical protein CM15mP4_3420 [Candidatus Neomarinimicrobiota bacterium]|nr:MAG: hypothetical protein CM15mP4_3420 [Candidatus Neomarinimicrobiota bacterium]